MKRTIEDSNFVTIHGWAITQLHLTSDEAIVYSLVDGAGAIGFSDSISYLASWIGASEDTARRILRRLVDAGILEEERVAGKTTTYRCIPLANCKGSQIARGRRAGLYCKYRWRKSKREPLANCKGWRPCRHYR